MTNKVEILHMTIRQLFNLMCRLPKDLILYQTVVNNLVLILDENTHEDKRK